MHPQVLGELQRCHQHSATGKTLSSKASSQCSCNWRLPMTTCQWQRLDAAAMARIMAQEHALAHAFTFTRWQTSVPFPLFASHATTARPYRAVHCRHAPLSSARVPFGPRCPFSETVMVCSTLLPHRQCSGLPALIEVLVHTPNPEAGTHRLG